MITNKIIYIWFGHRNWDIIWNNVIYDFQWDVIWNKITRYIFLNSTYWIQRLPSCDIKDNVIIVSEEVDLVLFAGNDSLPRVLNTTTWVLKLHNISLTALSNIPLYISLCKRGGCLLFHKHLFIFFTLHTFMSRVVRSNLMLLSYLHLGTKHYQCK